MLPVIERPLAPLIAPAPGWGLLHSPTLTVLHTPPAVAGGCIMEAGASAWHPCRAAHMCALARTAEPTMVGRPSAAPGALPVAQHKAAQPSTPVGQLQCPLHAKRLHASHGGAQLQTCVPPQLRLPPASRPADSPAGRHRCAAWPGAVLCCMHLPWAPRSQALTPADPFAAKLVEVGDKERTSSTRICVA